MLKLVEIQRDGSVDSSLTLSETAVSMCERLSHLYARQVFERPWTGYLAEADEQFVGMCAFKSAPVASKVEITYFTFPEYEGRGRASDMASALINIARAEDSGLTIAAHTLPSPGASTSILKKLGFIKAGEIMHPEDGLVWEWVLE